MVVWWRLVGWSVSRLQPVALWLFSVRQLFLWLVGCHFIAPLIIWKLGVGSSVFWVAGSFGQLVSHLVGASDDRVDDDEFGLSFVGCETSEEDDKDDDEG